MSNTPQPEPEKTPRRQPVLEIDIKGYRQTLSNKGKPRIMIEGLSNAFDADADTVEVTFTQEKGWAKLTVTDNDPDGFADLRDAYTLFSASRRREDPTKRGRFGQGEKELVALAVDGGTITVTSTRGTVTFNKDGREERDDKTDSGTVLTCRMKLNKFEADDFSELVRHLIVPEGVSFKFNGEYIAARPPERTINETLNTKIVDKDGNLTDSRRQTEVHFYTPRSNEVPYIYELGIPVVEHDGKFHVNVMQKVPLNTARDNVTPAYLKKVHQVMFDATYDLMDREDHLKGWVKDILAVASPEALAYHVETVHGKDAVIFDPSNPEANKRALDEGRQLIYGKQFKKDTWEKIKENNILKPAGKVIETFVPTSLDGAPSIEDEDWTPGMQALASYTRAVGQHLLGFEPTVTFYNQVLSGPHAEAMWGDREIIFNLRHLGKRWPAEAEVEVIDALLIHEFAHHYESDHFTDSYLRWTCKLGAKLRSCPVQIVRGA